MNILGIETSCDETSAAIIQNGRTICSNVVASSKELHDKTGGIIPEIAAREQVRSIIPVLQEALSLNQTSMNSIDAIAVTVGPGLIGSLLVGVETAKSLAYLLQKPVIPVHHIFAHLYANWLIQPEKNEEPTFPAIGLVVSGGHTELFLMKSHTQITWLGGTRDDAAGEAFDKTARMLGLGYGGGPSIAEKADAFRKNHSGSKIQLPRPMLHNDTLDFSFSGFKTAVSREVNRLKHMNCWNEEVMQEVAYEIEEAITDVLVKKTFLAVQKYDVSTLLVGGGVAANTRLSEKLTSSLITHNSSQLTVYIPPPSLCTDNAAYIASYAYYHYDPVPWQDIRAQPDLTVEVS